MNSMGRFNRQSRERMKSMNRTTTKSTEAACVGIVFFAAMFAASEPLGSAESPPGGIGLCGGVILVAMDVPATPPVFDPASGDSVCRRDGERAGFRHVRVFPGIARGDLN